MICRQCPQCKMVWYSAATSPWKCGQCGAELDDRHNKPVERGENIENLVELCRQKPGLSGLAEWREG